MGEFRTTAIKKKYIKAHFFFFFLNSCPNPLDNMRGSFPVDKQGKTTSHSQVRRFNVKTFAFLDPQTGHPSEEEVSTDKYKFVFIIFTNKIWLKQMINYCNSILRCTSTVGWKFVQMMSTVHRVVPSSVSGSCHTVHHVDLTHFYVLVLNLLVLTHSS